MYSECHAVATDKTVGGRELDVCMEHWMEHQIEAYSYTLAPRFYRLCSVFGFELLEEFGGNGDRAPAFEEDSEYDDMVDKYIKKAATDLAKGLAANLKRKRK